MQACLQAGKLLQVQHPQHLEQQQQLVLFLQGQLPQHLVLLVLLFLQEQRRLHHSQHVLHPQLLQLQQLVLPVAAQEMTGWTG
jgi:hypothetical protein